MSENPDHCSGALDRMTDRARTAIDCAQSLARERGAIAVNPEHILLALIRESAGVAGHVLRGLGASADWVEDAVPSVIATGAERVSPLPLSDESICTIKRAGEEVRRLGHQYIGTEHLVIGVANAPGVQRLIATIGLTPAIIQRDVYEILGLPPP